MKIALASWNGRIAPVFDVSRKLLVLETRHRRIHSQEESMLPQDDLFARIALLEQLEIDTLICGAVSRPLAGMVMAHGIRLISFVAGDIDDVVEACLDDALPHPSFSMPGCRGRHRRMEHSMGYAGGYAMGSECRRPKRCEPQTERRDNMPGGDGKGPNGQGPGSGLGQGPCGSGKRGRGQGGGKGRGNNTGNVFGGGRGTGRGRGGNNR